MAKFCTKCGKSVEKCTCGHATPSKAKRILTMTKDYFGIWDSDVKKEKNRLEYGKRIMPDIADPCDEEVPIKQYDMGRSRSRWTFSLGYFRIQVTNKRVIQRTVGHSLLGKDINHSEFAIDDIIGIDFTKGKQLSFGNLFLLLICSLIVGRIGASIGSHGWPVTAIFIIGFCWSFFYSLLIKKRLNNFLNTVLSSLAIGSMIGGVANIGNAVGGRISYYIYWVFFVPFIVIALIFLIRFSILPNVTLILKTKSMQGIGTFMASNKKMLGMNSRKIVLPAKDTETAIREIGAMITDIQKLGDFAIEKWKS